MGLPVSELSDPVVDGFGDNGIDGVYYNSASSTLYLVQSKWHNDGNGSIDREGIQKFIKGAKDIINGRFDRFNSKIQDKSIIINEALEDSKTRICLLIVYSGKDAFSKEVKEDISDFLNEQNDLSEIFTQKSISLSGLYKALVSGGGGSITEDVLIYSWGVVREPYYAIYGQIAVSDTAEWFNKHGVALFSPNIRVFLGETTVNEGISETLKNKPEDFWYFNNGITALANSIEKKPIGGASHDSGTFTCNDLAIVNGAQTIGTISKIYGSHPDEVKNAKVHIRIISLVDAPPDYGKEVTRTNNTQNRIDSRDFIALDPNQERLKTELMLEKVDYVYKNGEGYTNRDKGIDFVEAALARVFTIGTIEMAVTAKNSISKLWEDIEKPPYKLLFNPTINGPKLWLSVLVLRIIDEKINEIKNSKSGRDRLLAVHGNRAIAFLVFQAINSTISTIDKITPELTSQIKSITLNKYRHILANANSLYPDSYPANLFKNMTKTKNITQD